jgi:hypothetical protein
MNTYSNKINKYIIDLEKKTGRTHTITDLVYAVCTIYKKKEYITKKIMEYCIKDDIYEKIVINMLLINLFEYFELLIQIKKLNHVEIINKYAKDLLARTFNNNNLFDYIIKYIRPDILQEFIVEVWEINDWEYLKNFERIDGLGILLFINSDQVKYSFLNKRFNLLEKYIKMPENIIENNLKIFIELSLMYDDGDYLSWLLKKFPETMKYYYDILLTIKLSEYQNYKKFKLLCLYNSIKIICDL